MNRRYLILNADDFGLTPGMNTAIASLLRQRLITATSLLAPARYAQEAIELAVAGGYPVGVHWALHAEWPGEPWPSCANGETLAADGKQFAKEARGRDVARELAAQARALSDAGCVVDHADCHGTALYGMNGRLFFLPALRLCRRLDIPFRLPRSNAFLARQLGGPVPAPLAAAHRAVVMLARGMGVRLPDDMISDPRPVEEIGGYDALKAYYVDALRTAGEGITEMFLHPSEPEELMHVSPAAWQKRVWEYELLRSGDLLRAAEAEGFTLAAWADLRTPE